MTEEEILKLHTPEMISVLKSTDNVEDEALLEEISSKYDFLFIHPVRTYQIYLCFVQYVTALSESLEHLQTLIASCWVHY